MAIYLLDTVPEPSYQGAAMTDRELLELAAKASGIDLHFRKALMPKDPDVPCYLDVNSVGESNHPYWQPVIRWNPLTDDGDALRLAVKLGLDINYYRKDNKTSACLFQDGIQHRCIERTDWIDAYTATRRAIVRAAAEIGKAITTPNQKEK